MKLNNYRLPALGTALLLAVSMAGCGAASSAATAESAAEATAESTATGETADKYAYLADFDYSAPLDDNGYFAGVTATDYVTLPENFEKLVLPTGSDVVSDDALQSYIDSNILANYVATQQVTDRAAADGDTVNIDYVGSVDGVPFSGGDTKGSGADLVLGSHSYIDDFEAQIVGHTPGDSFDVTVTFPDPYTGNPDLSGKEAVFATTLNYIKEDATPTLTDEWVAENLSESMKLNTVNELKDYVRNQMLLNQESNAVYSALLQNSTFAAPLPEDVEDYARSCLLASPYSYAVSYGTDLETLLASSGFSGVEDYLANSGTTVESLAQQILLSQAIAEKKGLACDDAMLDEEFDKYYDDAARTQLTDTYGTNYLKMSVLRDLTLRTLAETASYTG